MPSDDPSHPLSGELQLESVRQSTLGPQTPAASMAVSGAALGIVRSSGSSAAQSRSRGGRRPHPSHQDSLLARLVAMTRAMTVPLIMRKGSEIIITMEVNQPL